MEKFKTTVRFTVISFVLIAGGITLFGLNPSAKVDAEGLRTDRQPVKTTEKNISAKEERAIITVASGTTG